jgi:predicted SnoaL-like aldol condensation-catalyzing enzyme
MPHKSIIQDFFNLIVVGQTQTAFDRYLSSDLIHHNRYCPPGRQWLLDGMLDADTQMPNKSITIYHIIEEGDKVVTYSKVEKEHISIAVMHLFKFNDQNQITELRDLGKAIESDLPNSTNIF